MNTINTTTSDNSSDSASNNKKSTKSEIEIVDQKIIKCINEINALKQKIQRDWSKQMSNHLKAFYLDDTTNNTTGDSLNSSNNDSVNNANNSSFSTDSTNANASDHEKKLLLLNKKLRSYEKRRQKLSFESKKEATKATNTSNSDETTGNRSNSATSNNTPLTNNNTSVLNNINNNVNNTNSSNSNLITPPPLTKVNSTNNIPNNVVISSNNNNINNNNNLNNKQQIISNSNRNGSFINNLNQQLTSKSDEFLLNSNKQINENEILNNNNSNDDDDQQASGQSGANLTSNKSYQTLESRNMMFLHMEQQLYYLKLHQEKMYSDIEDIQKKIQENQQSLLKELQHTYTQISDPIQKFNYNLYKSYETKLDELKTNFDRSLQTFDYKMDHCRRDIKDTKDDVTFIKNRIEILEKSQKIHNIETNPTNYHQLFFKLLDIILTLLTIVLLAFTNMIASIKFIFLLYPRTIVIFLFMYLICFYLVDYDKLDMYFHRYFLRDSNYTGMLDYVKHNTLDKYANKSSFIERIFSSIHGLIFQLGSKNSSPSSSSSSTP